MASETPHTVVVTGAAGGIGRAVTERLAAEGHVVLGLDRAPVDVDADVGRIVSASLDVGVESAYEALPGLLAGLPPILSLVTVAGVLRAGPAVDATLDDWNDQMSVNALGVFLAVRAVTRLMIAECDRDPLNRRGVVTVGSNAGSVPRAGMAVYAASKAAASAFTRSAGLELARHGIRANVVAPGTTRTTMLDVLGVPEVVEERSLAGDASAFRAGIPLGRLAEPDDIASVVAFLVSSDARHMTLQEVVVDGGASQR